MLQINKRNKDMEVGSTASILQNGRSGHFLITLWATLMSTHLNKTYLTKLRMKKERSLFLFAIFIPFPPLQE